MQSGSTAPRPTIL